MNLIDEGTKAGAFRRVHAAFVSEVVTATMRRITRRDRCSHRPSDAEAYLSSPSWSLRRSAADMPHAEPPNRISCADGR